MWFPEWMCDYLCNMQCVQALINEAQMRHKHQTTQPTHLNLNRPTVRSMRSVNRNR